MDERRPGAMMTTITGYAMNDHTATPIQRQTVCEHRLCIVLDGVTAVSLLCLPVELNYLAAGWAFYEGYIATREDISALSVESDRQRVTISTAAAGGVKARPVTVRAGVTGRTRQPSHGHERLTADHDEKPSFKISPSTIIDLWKQLDEHDSLHTLTFGVHSSALCSATQIEYFNADLSRHNTIYRAIGKCILEGTNPADRLLFFSGRFSSEIIKSILAAGFPVAVSRKMSTDKAIQLADEAGLTLGMMDRALELIIFSHRERLC